MVGVKRKVVFCVCGGEFLMRCDRRERHQSSLAWRPACLQAAGGNAFSGRGAGGNAFSGRGAGGKKLKSLFALHPDRDAPTPNTGALFSRKSENCCWISSRPVKCRGDMTLPDGETGIGMIPSASAWQAVVRSRASYLGDRYGNRTCFRYSP